MRFPGLAGLVLGAALVPAVAPRLGGGPAQGGAPGSEAPAEYRGGGDGLRAPLTWLRNLARGVLGRCRSQLRSRDERSGPFTHLAASQIGYGPTMRKLFTSHRRFRAFRVLDLRDGSVAFTGGAPALRVETDLLGANHEAWIGDFSPLRRTGRYRVVTDDGLESHPFDVGPDVYDAAVRAVQRSFYFQRAFTAIDPAHAEGPWTHSSDADRAPPGIIQGWHDAGDLTLYNASTSAALFWMLEAFSDFAPGADDSNIPESGNGVPDLLDEARWGLEWLLSMQDRGTGAFRNTTCQARHGAYGATTPGNVPAYTLGEVGTVPTARAAGTLAYASAVLRPFAPEFAARCLEAARRGYRYLQDHGQEDTDGPSCPAYRVDGDAEVGRHLRMYAAAGMLLATGDPAFREDFERNYEEIRHIPDYHHVNGFAAQLYLRAPAGDERRKAALRRRLEELSALAVRDGERHPYQWAGYYYWGSISNAFHRTGTFNAKRCLADPRRLDDCEQALASVHYALGRNALQLAYVSGLPGVTQGTTWAFHYWLRALDATPHDFPGMVAGGPVRDPDPRDHTFPAAWPYPAWGYWGDPAFPRDGDTAVDARHTDNDSWTTNESAINWQAAALYHLYLAQRMAKAGGAP